MWEMLIESPCLRLHNTLKELGIKKKNECVGLSLQAVYLIWRKILSRSDNTLRHYPQDAICSMS